MNDCTTQQRLQVSTDGTAGPYIMVPVSQLEEVKSILGRNHIRLWVAEHAISLNGAPEVAVINLGRDSDASAVQRILDGVC
jgi:hypothetical protein